MSLFAMHATDAAGRENQLETREAMCCGVVALNVGER